MRFIITIIFALGFSFCSYCQSKKGTRKQVIQDTLLLVWPIPAGAPPPPVNWDKRKLQCYAKKKNGSRCTNLTNRITGLCSSHEPKFIPPRITVHD